MEFFLTQVMNGISFGGILFLLASGLSLIFGVMKIVNVAHGSFYMLGGYVGLSVMWRTGNYLLAILAGAICIAAVGLAMERVFLRRFYLQDLPQMLLTVGFALIFRDIAFLIWGGDPFSFPLPKFLEGSMKMGEITFPVFRVFVVFIALAVAIGLAVFNAKTSLGAKLRACVDDNEMAGGVGINVPMVSGSMFALGAALAAFGGVFGGPFFGVYPGADFELLILCFVVVIVGGMGSLKGAALGSALVGLIDTFGKALIPDLSYFTLFAPMAIVLAVKPTGLFGKR
jgi:branched-chain amino acid transport system permease protein